IHFLASITYGSTKACVGHASRHRRQLPHKSGGGSSFSPSDGSKSSVVSRTPRKKKEPSIWLSSRVFFPSHPKPAYFASTRSWTGPVSTYVRASNGPVKRSRRDSLSASSFFRNTS